MILQKLAVVLEGVVPALQSLGGCVSIRFTCGSRLGGPPAQRQTFQDWVPLLQNSMSGFSATLCCDTSFRDERSHVVA